MKQVILLIASGLLIFACKTQHPTTAEQVLNAPLFQYQDLEPRWNSFENPTSGKGTGGTENKGAKGHPFDKLKAGESKVLLDVQEMGIITRMWFTISDRSPQMLRSLKIEMFWDGENKPAVSVPFGDFFGNGLGTMVAHHNELFSNPEGRSFNCFIPMPFKTGAKLVVTNEGNTDLKILFYDINFVKLKEWNDNNLYFHSFWNRDTATTPGVDYSILPKIEGKGRFLGVNFGVIGNPVYEKSWWGEGAVKMYLDGDNNFPTLVGTGAEDYIGTAWGQGVFVNSYTGSLVADKEKDHWTFYRYHIPDPIMFKNDLRVTIQVMGGNDKDKVIEMLEKGVSLIPVTIDSDEGFIRLMDSIQPVDLKAYDKVKGWTNFYRSDDYSSTAYFYLDKPVNQLPELVKTKIRTYKLELNKATKNPLQ
jgi:hypothetical protein